MAKKKATTKKVAPKKATKKPAKKTTKRSYVRKAALAEEAAPDILTDKADAIQHGKGGSAVDPCDCGDSVDDIGDFFRGLFNAVEQVQTNQSDEDLLREIEVIDLRGLKISDRFALLMMLTTNGYITSAGESIVEDLDNLRVGLEADALQLNHNNKLVSVLQWFSVELNDFRRISRPSVQMLAQIGFSLPEPAYPDETTIGNARYVRVG